MVVPKFRQNSCYAEERYPAHYNDGKNQDYRYSNVTLRHQQH